MRMRKNTDNMPPPIPDTRRVTAIKILGITITNHLSVGDHVRDVISKCAQSLYVLLNCVITACVTIRWGMFTRLSFFLSYCMLLRPGGDSPMLLINNVWKHHYGVRYAPAYTKFCAWTYYCITYLSFCLSRLSFVRTYCRIKVVIITVFI